MLLPPEVHPIDSDIKESAYLAINGYRDSQFSARTLVTLIAQGMLLCSIGRN